jgi:hypothetical protein
MRRPGGIVGVIVLVWLLIGVLAAWQRDYFKTGETNCATATNVALTVVAGPLNYANVNPKVDCKLPQPSSSAPALISGQESDRTIGVS